MGNSEVQCKVLHQISLLQRGIDFTQRRGENALNVLMTSPFWVLYLCSKAGHFGHFKWVFSYILSTLILKKLKQEFNTWNLIGFSKRKRLSVKKNFKIFIGL